MRKLTPKQDRFVDEYMIDGNATAAAGRAGYSDPSYGRQLLALPHVAAAIEERRAARSKRTEIDADRVLLELARIGLADIRELVVWDPEQGVSFVSSSQLSAEQAAAISGIKSETVTTTMPDGKTETRVKLELKMHDKNAALREAGKHLGVAQRLDVQAQTRTTGVLVIPADQNGSWASGARKAMQELDEIAAAAVAGATGNGTGGNGKAKNRLNGSG